MSRACIALALASGVPPQVWADEGERTIATAYVLLKEANRGARQAQGEDDGPQMSG